MINSQQFKANATFRQIIMIKVMKLQTSVVAHVRTNLLPERAKQTRSKTMIGSICHQVGQALSKRRSQVLNTVRMQTNRNLRIDAYYRKVVVL